MTSEALTDQHLRAMESGDLDLATRSIHPAHVNHMAAEEPPACSLPGVPGFLATSAWLRLAFDDLRFELVEQVNDGDLTIAHVRMVGHQTGPFVVFPVHGRPVAFPPTQRPFSVRQCHIFRTSEGQHIEHAAVRDDLGLMTQLGHLPPSPGAVARLARSKLSGKARAAIKLAVTTADLAAASAVPATGQAANVPAG